MKTKSLKNIAVSLSLCLMCALGAFGCSATATGSTVSENSSYMMQLNSVVDDFSDSLDAFVDAVSRDDAVSMQTQAENAYKVAQNLSSLTAPDDLADIHEGYLSALNTLEDALSDYIDLYLEVSGKSADGSIDWSGYEERLSSIQELYDSGISQLQETDQKVSEL